MLNIRKAAEYPRYATLVRNTYTKHHKASPIEATSIKVNVNQIDRCSLVCAHATTSQVPILYWSGASMPPCKYKYQASGWLWNDCR